MNLQLVNFISLAALWGASFYFMRLGAPEFGAVPMAFGRVTLAAAFLLPLVFWRGFGKQFRTGLFAIMAIGVLNSAIPFALYSYAALSVTAGFSSIINASTAIWTAVVSAIWFKERLNARRWLGVLIGFAGVLMLFWDRASVLPGKQWNDLLLAGLAGFVATWCYAFSSNLSKKHLNGVPAIVTAAGTQLGASVFLAPFAWWFWPTDMPSAQAWASLLGLALLCTALAYALYFALIDAWGASRSSAVTFVIPVFGIFWGWALLSEPVSSLMLASMLVIIVGTVLVIRK